jgi:hypothetical protein
VVTQHVEESHSGSAVPIILVKQLCHISLELQATFVQPQVKAWGPHTFFILFYPHFLSFAHSAYE